MNRAARIGIIFVSVAISCYASIGYVLGRTPDDKAYKSLTVYGEVLQKIQQDYVDDPNMRTVTAGSLHGMLESLDSQSSYLTPREYDEYKKKLANAGTAETGLTLSKRYGYIIVLSVLRIVRAQRREFAAATFSNPSADLPLATCPWARP